MFNKLYDEGAKWWYLSTEALYEEFKTARKNDDRPVGAEAFEFYAYCLEKYALAKGLTGLQALAVLKRYGADDFLFMVKGKILKEISLFVSGKLASIDEVQSTATHFALTKYKELGVDFNSKKSDERMKMTP